MARRRPPLSAVLHGTVVAELTSSGPGQVTCRYTPEALAAYELNAPVLSCSLPLSRRPATEAGRFFRGLLPEGAALAAAAALAGVPTYDTFGLLSRFGRDVAGACVIGTDVGERVPGGVEHYSDDGLAEEVADLDERPLALHDDSELSLPGLQNKLLLVRTPTGWARPVGGYPSSHILKVEDRRFAGLVSAEADALRLARRLGLTTVETEVHEMGGVDCLVVSRFDRTADNGRMHQEDLCQAVGADIDKARGRGKYEQYGGPGFADAARLLRLHAIDPARELRQLLRTVVFTYVIGNGDAHGKNLALLHRTPGHVELAPLYDTVPTILWPRLPDRAAMSIGGVTRLSAVRRSDILAEAVTWGMPVDRAEAVIEEFVDDCRSVLGETAVSDRLAVLLEERLALLASERLTP
ncbi:MAG: HipA domain-containing protein [Aeromicrobium sp.]|uniref:HipA domain-containing protein n=1 Tax=Aeromicrobium sp. TaxID=1871063 RepID=UPI0039E6633F